MFAIIAFICALLGLLKANLGTVGRDDFLYLAIMFIALSLVLDSIALGWFRSRNA